MRKILLLFLILFLFPCYCFAYTLSFQNEPNGFRDIQWGDSFDKISNGMVYSRTDPNSSEIKFYTRSNDVLNIGYGQAELIEYGFWQGKFISSRIITQGYANWRGLQDVLQSQFSIPNYDDPFKIGATNQQYTWLGKNTMITSRYDEITQKGEIYFYSLVYYSKSNGTETVSNVHLYADYLYNNRNYPIVYGHMGEASYLDTTSISVKQNDDHNITFTENIITVNADQGYKVTETRTVWYSQPTHWDRKTLSNLDDFGACISLDGVAWKGFYINDIHGYNQYARNGFLMGWEKIFCVNWPNK